MICLKKFSVIVGAFSLTMLSGCSVLRLGVQDTPEVKPVAPSIESKYSFDFRVTGSAEVSPYQVFSNGSFVFMQFKADAPLRSFSVDGRQVKPKRYGPYLAVEFSPRISISGSGTQTATVTYLTTDASVPVTAAPALAQSLTLKSQSVVALQSAAAAPVSAAPAAAADVAKPKEVLPTVPQAAPSLRLAASAAQVAAVIAKPAPVVVAPPAKQADPRSESSKNLSMEIQGYRPIEGEKFVTTLERYATKAGFSFVNEVGAGPSLNAKVQIEEKAGFVDGVLELLNAYQTSFTTPLRVKIDQGLQVLRLSPSQVVTAQTVSKKQEPIVSANTPKGVEASSLAKYVVKPNDASLVQLLVRWSTESGYKVDLNGHEAKPGALEQHPVQYAVIFLPPGLESFAVDSDLEGAIAQLSRKYAPFANQLPQFSVLVDKTTKTLRIATETQKPTANSKGSTS
jgi:hypothetical protein